MLPTTALPGSSNQKTRTRIATPLYHIYHIHASPPFPWSSVLVSFSLFLYHLVSFASHLSLLSLTHHIQYIFFLKSTRLPSSLPSPSPLLVSSSYFLFPTPPPHHTLPPYRPTNKLDSRARSAVYRTARSTFPTGEFSAPLRGLSRGRFWLV